MTEVLFCLSVGFVAYVVYVLVDEQIALNPVVPKEPILTAKPPRPRATRTTASATKTRSEATAKKSIPEDFDRTSTAILAYLGENGLTTIAKLARELAENRKTIEEKVDRLIQKGDVSLTTFRRAKAVDLVA